MEHLFALLSLDIDQTNVPAGMLLLFPEGDAVRANDGRPTDCNGWKLNKTNGEPLAAALNKRPIDMVIDYEHQTLLAKQNGKPSPAAGWIKSGSFVYVEGVGLCSNNFEYTAKAQAHIAAKEYRYKSPVISYTQDGTVVGLHSLALTNDPALSVLDEVALTALANSEASAVFFSHLTDHPTQKDSHMNEALKKLLAMLGLDANADEATVLASLTSIETTAKEKFDITLGKDAVTLDALAAKVAELSTQTDDAGNPDPAKFAPLSVVDELKAQLAELTSKQTQSEASELIQAALSDGRLLPAQQEWAQDYAAKDMNGFKAYLDKTPVIAGLTSNQTETVQDDDGNSVALTSEMKKVSELMGNDPVEVAKAMQTDA